MNLVYSFLLPNFNPSEDEIMCEETLIVGYPTIHSDKFKITKINGFNGSADFENHYILVNIVTVNSVSTSTGNVSLGSTIDTFIFRGSDAQYTAANFYLYTENYDSCVEYLDVYTDDYRDKGGSNVIDFYIKLKKTGVVAQVTYFSKDA